MAEYIERDAAEKELLYAMVGTGYQSRAIDAIRFMPTADVVEAQRGKVIVLDHDEWWSCVYECCTCKGQWMLEPRKPAICCPYCGVRLGGKGENK